VDHEQASLRDLRGLRGYISLWKRYQIAARGTGAIDIGRPSRAFPVTPPCVRVRTRRFGELCGRTRRGVSAGLSVALPVPNASALHSTCPWASPSGAASKARSPWIFRRPASAMAASYSPLPPFGPSGNRSPTMPSADSCAAVRAPHGTLSPDSGTRRRSPGVSTAAFRAQPPDLRFAPLMDMDFAVTCPLVRRSRLVSGFYSSARAFAPRFLQTPPRGDALALR
jgi:hypothetical protein